MNDRQFNKLSMYLAVIAYLIKNQAVTALAEGFAPVFEKFKLFVQACQLKSTEQAPTSERTAARNAAREVLVELIFKGTRALLLIAKSINNNALKDKIKLNKSELCKMREVEFNTFASEVIKELKVNAASAAKYGFTQAKIDKADSYYAEYSGTSDEKLTGGASSIAATRSLPDIFASADDLLEELDFMVDILDDDSPDFGIGYKVVRQIKDLGGRGGGGSDEPEPPAEPNPEG